MTPYWTDPWLTVYAGDCRAVLAEIEPESVHCVVTSPPYWGLRDYGVEGQIGLERTPEEYVATLVGIFHEIRRVLRPEGTVWLNLGDCYATGAGSVGDRPGGGEQGDRWAGTEQRGHRGQHLPNQSGKAAPRIAAMGPMTQPNRMPLTGLKPKDLVGIPWRVAFALQADGWYLRSDIIWAKPNPMPESVTDRPTKSHEYLFLLSKSARYFYDAEAVAGTRNLRSVWMVATQPYAGAHFATFPPKLIEPCIKAGSPEGGVVLDPFAGSGTTGMVAQSLSRRAILIDLNADYLVQAMRRNAQTPLGLGETVA